jgi:thymidylate kinase
MRLDTADAEMDAECAGLNSGQRAGVHAIFKTAKKITIVHGMGGSGKSTMMKVVCKLYAKHISENIVLTSHTGAATISLRESVAMPSKGVALTIMALCEHAEKLGLNSGGPPLIVVDEYLMTVAGRRGIRREDTLKGNQPKSVWDKFIETIDKHAPGYTLVLLGDPDQMAPGCRDTERPLWDKDTWLSELMESDAAAQSRADRRANYILLTKQERMRGAEGDAADFVDAIARVSSPQNAADEREAREVVAEFLVGAEFRSSAASIKDKRAIVAVQGVREALSINNAAVAAELGPGDKLFMLAQPAKGVKSTVPPVWLRAGGRARVRANQISETWRKFHPGPFGTKRLPKVYDVYNYQAVTFVEAAANADPPKGWKPPERPQAVPEYVEVEPVWVGKHASATVVRPDGKEIGMEPIAAEDSKHMLALTGLARPEAGTIALHQAKTYPAQPGQPVLFVISIAHWDLLSREELWMLITRCRDPGVLRIWPKQGPGRIRQKLTHISPRDARRTQFKLTFAHLSK